MRMRLGIGLDIVLIALVVSACDGSTPGAGGPIAQTTSAPTASTPAGPGGPRANRTLPPNFTPPANFTPGAQRPGAQRTPQAGATSVSGNATPQSTLVAPTAVAGGIITNTTSTVPTAVPIPQVIIPTAVPPSANPASTPANASNTSGSAPASTPVPLLTPSANAPTLESLRGKLVFLSDRDSPYPQLYVMEPDGSNVQPCNCSDLWQTLTTNEFTSPDKKQFLFVKSVGSGLRSGADMQIWAHNNETNADSLVTGEAPGFPGVDYDPVWSPDSRHVAWVSEADGNDEIYLHNIVTNENQRLTQNSWEFDKHPSFSPDGSQIVFWSNRETGRKQIWLMNLDGSNPRNISNNSYNDYDPIWVK